LFAQTTDPDKPDTPAAKEQTSGVTSQTVYEPITGRRRARWILVASFGPQSLGAGLFTSAIGTARDKPEEYGPHWEGYGDRYGMRLTGVVTSNAMEAGLGLLWNEDPRYFRATGQPVSRRIRHIVVATFATRRTDGHYGPAYARYLAVSGSNFLSNTWRVESEADTHHALERTGFGFLGKMTSNAFREFWPDARKLIFHHSD
jgi:hypothetical protein